MAAPRKSLTKAQIETAVGLELLQLLERITDDGKLDIEEIQTLQDWLIDNRSAGIPAIDHLIPVMARIAEDGVVSPAEISLLQKEIEIVLPADIRQIVKFKRKHFESQNKEIEKAEAAEAKKRNRKIRSFNVVVVGVNYEGRSQILNNMSGRLEGASVTLALELNNPYDSSAIAVIIHDKHVGYIPREEASWISGLLSTERYEAQVVKILDGHQCPIPVVSGVILNKDNTEGKGSFAKQQRFTGSRPKARRRSEEDIDDDDDDDGDGDSKERAPSTEASGGNGCMYAVLFAGVILFIVIALLWTS
jgi:hypothetical protein